MQTLFLTEFDRDIGISSIVETLGGSDVTQIFVHYVTELVKSVNTDSLEVTLPGFQRYPERSLVFARTNDIVCVLSGVEDKYLEFLSSLDIGPRKENVVEVPEISMDGKPNASLSDLLIDNPSALLDTRELVERNGHIVINPYISSPKEIKLSEVLEKMLGTKIDLFGGDLNIVDYANYKHNIRAKALELGVPIPKGDVVELQLNQNGNPIDLTPLENILNRYLFKTGKVVIRGSYGFSGSSIILVEDSPESIRKALKSIEEKTDNKIYLVEVMYDINVSPNIVFYLEPGTGGPLCVSVSDQILSYDLAHEGNAYPSTAKMLWYMMDSARRISKWLQTEGYRGFIGFDFVEYINPETGQTAYFLAEVNPRVNSAVYPKSLIEHLNRRQMQNGRKQIEAFFSTKVKTKLSSFAELKELCGHLFFNPETGKGVFPYNTGCLKYGSFTATSLGETREEVENISKHFKASLAG